MDTGHWIENTGEPRARKRASVVRRRAGGKGLCKQYLACCLSYFVLFHSDKAVLDQAAARLTEWLSDMGLELKPSKTKVTHTLTPVGGNVGFDFLGFTIRQFHVGKTHSGTHPHGGTLGFKTIIRPSKEAIKRHIYDVNQTLAEIAQCLARDTHQGTQSGHSWMG